MLHGIRERKVPALGLKCALTPCTSSKPGAGRRAAVLPWKNGGVGGHLAGGAGNFDERGRRAAVGGGGRHRAGEQLRAQRGRGPSQATPLYGIVPVFGHQI